jgi:hypothetical protein
MRKLSIVVTVLCVCTAFAVAASAQERPLCERLGGTDAISAVVDSFAGKVLKDDRVDKAPCGRTLQHQPLYQGPARCALEAYVPRLITCPSS